MVVQDPIDLQYCDHEPRSWQAWQKSGLNPLFIKPILDVANIYNMIIIIRGNDPNYISLLTDRYTTKSMYLHSKTCSWGPMTGFVCFDPTFHKKSTRNTAQKESQLRCLIESIKYSKAHHKLTRLSPLRITEQRRKELEKNKKIKTLSINPGVHIVEANQPTEPNEPGAQVLFGEGYRKKTFELARVENGLWAVRYLDVGVSPDQIFEQCYQYADTFTYLDLLSDIPKLSAWVRHKNFHPRAVLALVDPTCPYGEDDFRCATTGDYDLFAIHPLLAHYAAGISILPGNLNARAMQADQIPNWIRIPSSTKLYIGTPEADLIRRTRRRTQLVDRSSGRPISLRADVAGWARTPPPSTPGSPVVQSSPYQDFPPLPGFTSLGFPRLPSSTSIGSPPPPRPSSSTSHRSISEGSSPNARSPTGDSLAGGAQTQVTISVTSATPVHGRAQNFPAPASLSPSVPLQGALTTRELELISELNHRVNYGGSLHSLRLFHHGPDSHNPHGTSPDLPCIALLPCATHSTPERPANCFRGVYISDEKKLEDFYFWNVICSGYALTPGINIKWFTERDPQPLIVYDQDREMQRNVILPRREMLNKHIEFERYLNNHIETLLRESMALWKEEQISPDHDPSSARRLRFDE